MMNETDIRRSGEARAFSRRSGRLLSGLLGAILLLLAAFPGLAQAENTLAPYALPDRIQAELTALEASGFLAPGAQPYTYANREEGLWLYLDEELRIEIHRMEDPAIPLIWFESYVSCRGDAGLQTYEAGSGKSEGHFKMPDVMARDSGFIFATSDDFYGYRVLSKFKVGTVIRHGQMISDQQTPYSDERFPTMDLLAVYPDGSMKIHMSEETTARMLLDQGVETALCFGPALVRAGEIDPRVYGKNYADLEPRHALGMIAPRQYVFLTALGRRTNSQGTGLKWMAEKMAALGATEALNLDGGNTITLLFMGETIHRDPNNKSNRPISSVIGFGSMK